ncbi:Annexin [Plakobranchus ocellatus]|uniref:Annexin n=1 Tax=Plakobranchus ocellatus TaxID=259542 RepID=A0AAV4ACL0_9GAST|nr:Annexin [Plakobranchus ocellatus]
MSYPPYGGGGYPPQPGFSAPGGYGGGPGYPQQPGGYPPPGGAGMPTPESASAAAYGSAAPGGMPYAPQPGGNIGFNSGPPMPGMGPGPGYPGQAPMPGGPTGYPPQGGAYPGAQPGYPGGQPGYPGAQPGYGSAPPPGPGYNPAPPGGFGGPAPGYGQQPQQQPPYGAGGVGGPAGGYPGAPPAGGYGAPPAGGYGGPAPAAGGAGYGAQAPPSGGYGGAPQAPQQQYGGYGNPGAAGANYGNVPPAANYKTYEEGTLKPYSNFNAEQDCQALRKAMKGFGTDEKVIIDILGNRSNDQRQNIKLMYKTCFGRDLVSDLKSELSSNFEDACVALMMRSDEFDAYELRRAMRGAGTDEAALIEILCTRNNSQIKAMVATYKLMYGRNLEKDIISETSGHFKKLLVSMTAGGRQEHQAVDVNKARQDAQRLYQAGEKRWGTDENTFNMILASQSYEQCRAVFDEYIRVSHHDIEQAIKNEMSGDLCTGMLTIVRMIRNKHAYFADRLYHSMKGLGTDDRTLIRVIVSRCEVDMKQIKAEFQKRYGQGLEAFVRGDVSGDYKKLMLTLISGY